MQFPPPTAQDLARLAFTESVSRVRRLVSLVSRPVQNADCMDVEWRWLEDSCHRLACDAELLRKIRPFPEPTTCSIYLHGEYLHLQDLVRLLKKAQALHTAEDWELLKLCGYTDNSQDYLIDAAQTLRDIDAALTVGAAISANDSTQH